MADNRASGLLACETNKQKYGEDFYKIIGAQGGKAVYQGLKGFAANKERARIAGAKGGHVSRWVKK